MVRSANLLYEFGPFRLDPAERLLLRDGRAVPLTPKVFDILVLLIENGGRLLEKDELMRRVWPDSFVEEGNLTFNISVLRKALGEGHGHHPYIETVPRRGYRFVADVREVSGVAPDLLLEDYTKIRVITEEEEESNTRDEAVLSGEPWVRPASAFQQLAGTLARRRNNIGLAVVFLLVLAVGVYYFYFAGREQAVDSRRQAIDSVAVLPFVNVSDNPETEDLSDGITQGAIYSLSQLPQLKVVSRNSVFRYKGREINVQAVGRELGVRAVLTGRVVRRGDDLSVSVELVDTRDGRVLWGKQFLRRLPDILTLQSEMAKEISESLRLRLSGEDERRLAKRYTDNAEAYQLYLKGRYFFDKRSPEGIKKAIECFQRAIDIDPDYALAYAGLSDAYRSGWADLPPEQAAARSRAAAMRALELDDMLAEVHTTLAQLRKRDGDWLAAEREFLRAIELNPNYPTAHHWYSRQLACVGRMDEAIAEASKAQALDPLSLIVNTNLGEVLYWARRYDEAIEIHKKTLEMDPSFFNARTGLGWAYEQKGMYEEAMAEFQKVIEATGDDHERVLLAHVYAVSGRRDEARKMLREMRERSDISAAEIAAIYAALGETDQSFAWLETAHQEQSPVLQFLTVNPYWDVLRPDPRFDDLVRRVGIPRQNDN